MANTFQFIENQTLGSTQTSITLGSGGTIPQTFTDLKIVVSARITGSSYTEGFALSVNNGSSYSDIEFYNQNGTGASYGVRSSSTELFLGHVPSGSATASTFGNHEIYIPNYTSSGLKSLLSDGTTETNGTQVYQTLIIGKITNGNAITSLTFTSYGVGFSSGSSFTIYGIKNS